MTPAQEVISLRAASGLTQDQLARRLGVSTRTLQRWERGDVWSFRAMAMEKQATRFRVSDITGF